MEKPQHKSELVRFTTAGSVDDGKSTLIGRLLYDTKSVFQDQLESIQEAGQRRGEKEINLALLTDGLRAEREQGITIDVAYRYFSTPKRKFIIADSPGHIQYTRNMVTGASTANIALILVDARKGIVEQTRRHAFIASLLQIPHLLICINKMDLVNYEETTFEKIRQEFADFAIKLNVKDLQFIPISALKGDNVVTKSDNMPWYDGSTLLYYLDHVHVASDHNLIDCRFPIQMVIRPNNDAFHDYRAYAGQIAGGVFKKGDKVTLLPSGFTTKILAIEMAADPVNEAFPPMSVTMQLEDDFDLSRGDMLVRPQNQPRITQDLEVMVCWFSNKPLQERGKYMALHTTREVRCMIKTIRYKLDINTLHRDQEDKNIGMNDICRLELRTTRPLFVDAYNKNRITGSIILVDEATNETVGAGMVI